jgi:HK97 family phage portal protein
MLGFLSRMFAATQPTVAPPAEAKASTTAPQVYSLYSGQEAWGVYHKRNPAQYSDEAYRRNSVAFMCVNMLARSAAAIPWRVVRGADANGRGGTDVEDGHPLARLLRMPNPGQSGKTLREAVMAYYNLSGNAYIEAVGPDGRQPLELHPLRPDRMRVKPGPMGPAGYVYEAGGRIKDFEHDPITGAGPILHIKTFSPLDDWYGLSPVEAAATAVDGHNLAGDWNQALLQNGCKPSGAMVYRPGQTGAANLTEEQRGAMREQLNAAVAGSRNAGRALILEGDFDWKQMSMSPADMDWLNGKNANAREICTVFRVPPMLLGIPGDNTYSNYQEARAALYMDVLIPLDAELASNLTRWLAPLFGGDLQIVQDIENLPALAEARQKRWDAVAAASWMTINEKRRAVGMEDYKHPNADRLYVPPSMIPLEDTTMPPEPGDETPAGDPPADPADEPEEPEDDAEEPEDDAEPILRNVRAGGNGRA